MNRTYQAAFTAGEIAPELTGRLDMTTYVNGLQRCRNMVVKPQGSLFKRPGFRFIRKVKDSTKKTRLIVFRYGAGQNLLIEMGAGYFRFFQNGAVLESSPGVPYEVANPYAEADLFGIDYTQSFDVMTLTHPNYAARELRRLGPTSWTLTNANTTPVSITVTPTTISRQYAEVLRLTCDTTDTTRWNSGVSTSTGLKSTGFIVGDSLWASNNSDGTGNWNGSEPPGIVMVIESTPADPPFIRFRKKDGTIYTGTGGNQTWFRRTAIGAGNDYQVTAVYADSTESLPAALPSSDVDLDIEGSKNVFTWTAVAGAIAYRVYRRLGSTYGLLGEVTATTFTDDGKVNPDTGRTPPRTDGISYGNPAACGYYEQRRVFAGFANFPQDGLMTRTGTESDMTFRQPGQDDDRIAFRVSSRSASSIRFLLPMSQMVMLTDEDVFRLTPINSDALTPETVAVRPQGGYGAAKVRPSIVGNVALYIAERGSHVLEISWQSEAEGYVPRDLSLRAPHLVENRTITDFAFLQNPVPVGFGATSDGRLLGMTYVPEEKVGAWHWHDSVSQFPGIPAAFESVVQVPEGNEDVLYVIVRRALGDGAGGGAFYRCIERMDSLRIPTDVGDERFVDCHLTFDGNTAPAGVTLSFTAGAPAGTAVGYFVNSSSALFAPSSVGRYLCIYETTADPGGFGATNPRGKRHFFEIVTYTSSTTVIARMVNDSYLVNGVGLDAVPQANWAWAEDSFTLAHLPGAILYGTADGRPVGPVVTDLVTGAFTIPFPAVKATFGLSYPAEVHLLPPMVQAEALSLGQTRSVDKVVLKLLQSGGYYVGTDPVAPTSKLAPYGNAFDAGWSSVGAAPASGQFFFSGEFDVNAPAKWRPDLGAYIRQVSPLPLRILGVALNIQIGGS